MTSVIAIHILATMATVNTPSTEILTGNSNHKQPRSAKPLHLQMSPQQRTLWARRHAGTTFGIAAIARRHRTTRQRVWQIFHGLRGWDRRFGAFRAASQAKISASIEKAILSSRTGQTPKSQSVEGRRLPDSEETNGGGDSDPPIPIPAQGKLSSGPDEIARDWTNSSFRKPPGRSNIMFSDEMKRLRVSMREIAEVAGVALGTMWAWTHGQRIAEGSDAAIRTALKRIVARQISENAAVLGRL